MEIEPAIGSDQSSILAREVMSSRILRRAEKIEALEWRAKDEFDPPRQMPTTASTPEMKRKRLALSIERPDGSEVLSIYT